jgi:hypothetical protein
LEHGLALGASRPVTGAQKENPAVGTPGWIFYCYRSLRFQLCGLAAISFSSFLYVQLIFRSTSSSFFFFFVSG